MQASAQTNRTPGGLPCKWTVVIVVIFGLFMVALAYACWSLSFVSLQTPFSQYQLLLILRGFGLGLSAQPLTVAILSNIKPKDLSQANSLNSVIRSVAGSVGVAVLSSLVQTQTSVHYAHLAGQLINQLQAAFAPHAASQEAATAAAIQQISNQLMGQANMLAIDDTFLFTLAITVAAIVLVLLIPIPPQPKGKAKPVPME